MKKNSILYLIRKRLGKLRRKVCKTNKACWYCKNIKDGSISSHKKKRGLKFEFLNYSETLQWIRANQDKFPWILKEKEIHSANIYSHYYPNLKSKGEIIGFIKIGVDHVYIEDYEGEINLKDDEAFIYDTFILPEFRKRYFGRIMLQCALNELERNGFMYVFCHIPDWNMASIRLYTSLGFIRVAYVRYLRIMRYRFFSNNVDKIKKIGKTKVAKFF